MNNHCKQILTVFSAALNIGFIVAAITIYWHHPSESHYRYSTNAKKIIEASEFSPAEKENLIKYLEQFTRQISAVGTDLHQSQIALLKVLSAPGPMDYAAFDETYARQNILWDKKHQLLRDHLLHMRKELGDEKSAWFFSQMLTNNK